MNSINKFKSITDYIYGLMTIPNYYFKFIDSIHVQRLRNIRQLPTAQYVFPSVNHSCFEHSLGTYFLSNKFITDLKNRQSDLDINQTLINTISLCGLFNNLGTVPFLNSFKNFYKEKYKMEYDYKSKAYEIIEDLLESKGIDPECTTNKNDNENFYLNIIKNIFTKNNNHLKFYEKIVFNPKTKIDCESFDNLNRDIYKYGLNPLFDHNILMNSSFIINDDICYGYQDAFSVYEYYNSKYTIATKFYFHRISTAIELMITDVLKYIDLVNDIKDNIIDNNDKFIYFFDSFIHNIKNSNKDNNRNIKEAKLILDNIDKRNLYTFVGEYYLSNKESENDFDNFNVNTLLENKSKEDIEIKEDEIRIKKDIIYLGVDDDDPLLNISFYDNYFNIIKRKRDEVSKLLPNRYKSKIIRVFLTNKDKKKIEVVQNALNNYKKKYKGYTHLYKSEQKINDEEYISHFNIGNDNNPAHQFKDYNDYFKNVINKDKNKNTKNI